jgi:uncharacterized protein YndB with AHSA1/START domain
MIDTTTRPAAASELEFRIELERRIDAPIEDVFEAILAQMGPDNVTPDETPLSMRIEPFPGGRWYRDLGDGNGHFWAHVQAIKRPTLLELTGPLFMSQAVCNNVQYRLAADGDGTTLRLVHSAFGLVPEEARDGMPEGWKDLLDRVERRLA